MNNSDKYNGIYRAKVLMTDALEDDKLGRVRCEVYPMLVGVDTATDLDNVEGIVTTQLPWAIPAMPLFAGALTAGSGSFVIPEVESFVWVFFEAGDIYQPVYFAEAQTAGAGIPSERLTDYPYTKVWKSAGGVIITINDKEGSEKINVLHPSGSNIQIDSGGNINISGTTVNINT